MALPMTVGKIGNANVVFVSSSSFCLPSDLPHSSAPAPRPPLASIPAPIHLASHIVLPLYRLHPHPHPHPHHQSSITSSSLYLSSSCLPFSSLSCKSRFQTHELFCQKHRHLPFARSTRLRTCCRARKYLKETVPEAKAPRNEREVTKDSRQSSKPVPEAEAEEEEVEISWIQEKSEDLLQFTQAAVGRIPGPRVGNSSMPWLVAVPLGYLAITFLSAVYKTIRKYNSAKEKRRRQIGRNAFLVQSLDEFLPSKRLELNDNKLHDLEKKCGFDTTEVLRKYIRYALNERAFSPDVVADLIHLRKVAKLDNGAVAEVLNEVARRIVQEKGPVVMDTRGFTEKGVKRKASVQSLFSKLLYLSELEEFCPASSRSSLSIKEIFGVTDEDANSIRIDTLSELSDLDSLEKMVLSESDEDESLK